MERELGSFNGLAINEDKPRVKLSDYCERGRNLSGFGMGGNSSEDQILLSC